MIKRLCTLSATLLAFIGLSASAQAYEFTQQCSDGSGATWPNSKLPLPYYINSAGSDNMAMTKVQSIFASSFEEWTKPCCSGFSSRYGGTTSKTALNNNFEIVLSFVENQNGWPQELGDPYGGVIAVTLLRYGRSCTIVDAPIVFNGIAHNYTDNCTSRGCANGGTDLQGVATHEIGHLLGLDHSPVQSATMFYAYTGGDGARSLHQDDRDGVCALYTRPCSCTSDSECPGELEQCVNAQCQFVPCTQDTQCDEGLVCNRNTGRCGVPPCANDAECGEGFSCVNTQCVSTCPICRTCTASNQCGAGGTCVDFNGDGGGECITFCGENGQCPGDAVCYQLQQDGQVYNLCLNPNANQGVCPPDYVCMEPIDPCADVTCQPGSYCDRGQCLADLTDCVNIKCAAGKVCQEGQCLEDPTDCRNIKCAAGKVCQEGQCVVDANASKNQDMGQSSSDMGGEEVLILSPNQATVNGTNSSCCAVAPHKRAGNPGLALTLGFMTLLGMGGLSRRRKRA